MIHRAVSKVEPIKAVNLSMPEALAEARATREPRLVPQPVYADDRGFSFMNQFVGVLGPASGGDGGQVNYSVQYPGVIKAWHRHAKQTDFWLCLTGHLKVGVFDQDSGRAWQAVIGDRRPAAAIIPPPLWHGAATVGPSPAGLLYYVTHAFNASAPDEERAAHDAFVGFPWHVEHK